MTRATRQPNRAGNHPIRITFARAAFFAAVILALLASYPAAAQQFDQNLFKGMKWRSIGPYRGGRSLAVAGVPGDPTVYYFGGVAAASGSPPTRARPGSRSSTRKGSPPSEASRSPLPIP